MNQSKVWHPARHAFFMIKTAQEYLVEVGLKTLTNLPVLDQKDTQTNSLIDCKVGGKF